MATKWFALSVLFIVPTLALSQQDNGRRSDDKGGWLGVEFVIESDKKRIVIIDLQPDGPAKQANLKLGDVIAKVGNIHPKDAQQFTDEIARQKPGDKITLTVMRDGKENKIEVTVGRRPEGVSRQ
jgi:S1-C subfamily serine protease